MTWKAPPYLFVFDVESIGLHGEGFAVAFVVVRTSDDSTVDSAVLSCPASSAAGSDPDRAWIADHVLPHLTEPTTHGAPRDLRRGFWIRWSYWQERGAVMAADVCWPVEARFLSACIDDEPGLHRSRHAPYPLLDIASVRAGAGLDPLATVPRLPDEQPAHHPLADARQSARLLLEALAISKKAEPAGDDIPVDESAGVIRRYQKRALTIEAMRHDGTFDSRDQCRLWLAQFGERCDWLHHADSTYHLKIDTLEGMMSVCPGAYIIRGVKGEFYPCDEDIFRASYRSAEEGSDAG